MRINLTPKTGAYEAIWEESNGEDGSTAVVRESIDSQNVAIEFDGVRMTVEEFRQHVRDLRAANVRAIETLSELASVRAELQEVKDQLELERRQFDAQSLGSDAYYEERLTEHNSRNLRLVEENQRIKDDRDHWENEANNWQSAYEQLARSRDSEVAEAKARTRDAVEQCNEWMNTAVTFSTVLSNIRAEIDKLKTE